MRDLPMKCTWLDNGLTFLFARVFFAALLFSTILIIWMSPFYFIDCTFTVFLEVNSVDPVQTPQFAASELGRHCLHSLQKRVFGRKTFGTNFCCFTDGILGFATGNIRPHIGASIPLWAITMAWKITTHI